MRCFGRSLAKRNALQWSKEVDVTGDHTLDKLKSLPSNDTSVVFSLTRDPLNHFVSGFTEHVYRQLERVQMFLSTSRPADSREFFEMYVERAISTISSKTSFVTVDFEHIYSQVAYLYRLSNIGFNVSSIHSEDISEASRMPSILAQYHNITDIPENMTIDRTCGQHPTSKDPLNTTLNAKEVLQNPRNARTQAVCLLHIFDYACMPRYLHDEHVCFQVFRRHHRRLKEISETYG